MLGELIGGPLSDFWRNQWIRRTGGKAFAPEQRLWLAYLGYPLSIAGVVIFCVTLAEAKPLHWIITPIVGIAVAGFGTQIITTIVVTCKPHKFSLSRWALVRGSSNTPTLLQTVPIATQRLNPLPSASLSTLCAALGVL